MISIVLIEWWSFSLTKVMTLMFDLIVVFLAYINCIHIIVVRNNYPRNSFFLEKM